MSFGVSPVNYSNSDKRINAGEHISKKYVWDSEKAEDFKFNIDSNTVAFMNLQRQLSSAVSRYRF